MTRSRVLVGFVLAAMLWVAAGCNKKSSSGGGGGGDGGGPQGGTGFPSGGQPGGPQAVGPKGMFDAHCAKCHTVGGSGGKGKGPDLTHVGGEHDAAWIAEHIRDPKKHKPNSRMPAFDRLTDEEVKSLADYLAAMK